MTGPALENALEIIFWVSLLILFYSYIGYGLLLIVLVGIKRLFVNKRSENNTANPPVTILIAAYNEAPVLERTIVRLLELDYPPESLEIIIVSDGSDDASADILKRYPSIKHLHQAERKGKLAAINRAIPYANAEILVFCDANSILNKESIAKIARHYSNTRVGGVAGEKKIELLPEGSVSGDGEGLYWKYESLLKKLDSELYTTVGAAGELFSIRRSLYEFLPDDTIIEDFVQSLKLCAKGFIVKYEPEAFASELPSQSIEDEMKRKVRISAGAFQAMTRLGALFNPFRRPVVFFQFISHRILRWTLCPLALLLLLISNIVLVVMNSYLIYYIALALQFIFYAFALTGWFNARRNKSGKLFNIPFYFLFMNIAVFIGFGRFVSKRQRAVWDKASRTNI